MGEFPPSDDPPSPLNFVTLPPTRMGGLLAQRAGHPGGRASFESCRHAVSRRPGVPTRCRAATRLTLGLVVGQEPHARQRHRRLWDIGRSR